MTLNVERQQMPTRITQMENPQSDRTILRVEGSLLLQDAELLETLCRGVGDQTTKPITLDVVDLTFIDQDSASVLCRLKREQGVRLEGLRLSIAVVVKLVEESEKGC
jgi:hypothetical protein